MHPLELHPAHDQCPYDHGLHPHDDAHRYLSQMNDDAKTTKCAFSWLSTGKVCERWSAAYAALGFWGRS